MMPDLFASATACQCEACTDEVGATYSRAWLRACLVRSIAKSGTRAPFLQRYAEHHGDDEAQKLADEVRKELGRMKS